MMEEWLGKILSSVPLENALLVAGIYFLSWSVRELMGAAKKLVPLFLGIVCIGLSVAMYLTRPMEVKATPEQPTIPDTRGSKFKKVENAAIRGCNLATVTDATVGQCMKECLDWREFVCRSFDYYKRSSKCDLCDKKEQEIPDGLKRDYRGDPYDYYERVEGQ